MASKRRPYAGELASPIILPIPPAFEGAVTKARLKEFGQMRERHERETTDGAKWKLSEKMSLLTKYYGVADGDMTALAWALAFEHVPGFKLEPEKKSNRGRKREWDGPKLLDLHVDVDTVKQLHGLTDRAALNFIASNADFSMKWSAPATYRNTRKQWLETLESRLQDAKRYVAMLQSVYEPRGEHVPTAAQLLARVRRNPAENSGKS